MFYSESFGRIFWVDDNHDFKSCPWQVDGTGDFDQEDYVSEWTDWEGVNICLLYTSPSPRDRQKSRMPSSA